MNTNIDNNITNEFDSDIADVFTDENINSKTDISNDTTTTNNIVTNIKSKVSKFGIALVGMVVGTAVLVTGALTFFEPMNVVVGSGTPTPNGYVAGLYTVRDYWTTITPMPGQVGRHWDAYMSSIQANATVTPNWNAVKTVVAYNATLGLKSAPGIVFFDNRNNATDTIYLPSGIPTVTYTAGTCSEVAPDYSSSIFIDWYDRTVKNFCSWANTDSNIGIIPMQLGSTGETINTYDEANNCGADKQQIFEQIVSAEEYRTWVKHAITTWKTYCPDKALTLATHLGDVYNKSGWASAKYYLSYLYPPTATPGAPKSGATPAPTPIYGVADRFNGFQPGDEQNYRYGLTAPWGRLQTGATFDTVGGAAYETAYGPGDIVSKMPTAERIGNARDMTLSAIGAGKATNLFYQITSVSTPAVCGWNCYIDSWLVNVMQKTMGKSAADATYTWARFRDAEVGRIGTELNYSSSDWPGPYTSLMTVSWDKEPTRYCWSSIYTKGISYNYIAPTPQPCQSTASSTVPETRYTLSFPASTVVGLNLDDTWVYAGRFTKTYTITLQYINKGTDTFTIAYNNGSGETVRTVTKTDTGIPATETWSTNAQFYNSISGTNDIEIRTGSGADEFYFASVEVASGSTIPTATPTRTMTPTRTVAPTSTPTGTPATVTVTPVATASVAETNSVTNYIYAAEKDISHATDHRLVMEYRNGAVSGNSLIEFDALVAPGNAYAVKSAILRVYMIDAQGGNYNNQTYNYLFNVYRALREWGSVSTWQRANNTEDWEVGGARGNTDRTIIGKANSGAFYYYLTDGNYALDINVTDIVQAWFTDSATNYCFVLEPDRLCQSANCLAWLILASGAHPEVSLRPQLTVTYLYNTTNTPTPTATYTPTAVPTLVATQPAATSTPTGTATSTPTPLPGLKINELCPDPSSDLDLNGFVTPDDRAIELYNPDTTTLDLAGYILMWNNAGYNNGDIAYTYKFPKFTTIAPNGYKVIYSYQLRNAYGDKFIMPGGVDYLQHTVQLFEPGNSVPLDTLMYWPVAKWACWARYTNGSANWVYNLGPTLGKLNR